MRHIATKFAPPYLKYYYSKIKHLTKLIFLAPEFYKIYIENLKRKADFTPKQLVGNLKKISSWHSNFEELLDFWKLDPEFNEIFKKASKTKGNWPLRCFMLYQFLNQVKELEGDIVEIGVYKGRSGKVLALTAKKFGKNVFLFDTFKGMPNTDPINDKFFKKGDFGDTSFNEVKKFLSDCSNVKIYPGFFPETAKPIKDKRFCFVHVDVDIYKSVKDCCEFFYPRMNKGGIIVFDDPGFSDCAGAKLAVDEFFSNKKETPIYLSSGQVLVIKK